jgi:hypothetical protein
MARESGVVASMVLIAVANDPATAGHSMAGHDRTFLSIRPHLGSDTTCGQ